MREGGGGGSGGGGEGEIRVLDGSHGLYSQQLNNIICRSWFNRINTQNNAILIIWFIGYFKMVLQIEKLQISWTKTDPDQNPFKNQPNSYSSSVSVRIFSPIRFLHTPSEVGGGKVLAEIVNAEKALYFEGWKANTIETHSIQFTNLYDSLFRLPKPLPQA